jgi:hypothetical protein
VRRPLGDSGTDVWPERRRWQVVPSVERYLSVGDEACPFVAPATDDPAAGSRRALPPQLVPIVRELAGRVRRSGGDEDLHEQAGVLFGEVLDCARELPDPRARELATRAPDLDAWETVVLLSATIAAGLRYPTLRPERRKASGREPWEGGTAPPPSRAGRWLEALELAWTSARLLTHDVGAITRLARAVLRGGAAGVCRHYATLLQALFLAAKRATGRHAHAHVITIGGYARRHQTWGHSWTLFVDERRARIVALDLTGADWLIDRGHASGVLNRGFDATTASNASALLGTIFVDAMIAPIEATDVVPLLIRPSTVRGQTLLLGLALQDALHPECRERVVAFLGARGLDRHLPGWRAALRIRHDFRRTALRIGDPAEQHRLLDAVGVT